MKAHILVLKNVCNMVHCHAQVIIDVAWEALLVVHHKIIKKIAWEALLVGEMAFQNEV